MAISVAGSPTRTRAVVKKYHVGARRKYDCLVTDTECAGTQIPDAPLRPPSQGTRLRTSQTFRMYKLERLK
jgi:hypothetical protein